MGHLVTFSETRWVDQTNTLRSFLANLPGLRRVLLADGHVDHPFSVPPSVAFAINDGATEATAKTVAPCLKLLFRVPAFLEADASPLSSVLGLFSGYYITLRGDVFVLSASVRTFLSRSLVSRCSVWSHPLMVSDVSLDPHLLP